MKRGNAPIRSPETTGSLSRGPVSFSDVHFTVTAPQRPLSPAPSCVHVQELEAWNGTDRHRFDAFVPQQDLVDSYLPSFQECVEQGKSSGVMCSCRWRIEWWPISNVQRPAWRRRPHFRALTTTLRSSNAHAPRHRQCGERRALMRKLVAA